MGTPVGPEPSVNRSKCRCGPSPAHPRYPGCRPRNAKGPSARQPPQQDAFRGAGATAGRGGGGLDGRRSPFVHHHGRNLGRRRGEWRRSPRGGPAGAGPASRTPSISRRAAQRRPPRRGWVMLRWEEDAVPGAHRSSWPGPEVDPPIGMPKPAAAHGPWHVLRQRCGRSLAANVVECAGAVGVVRAGAALEPSGPGT